MKVTILLLLAVFAAVANARLTIRHRRQVEREGMPPSEVVVIKDTINPSLPGPLYLVPRPPGPGEAFDLDINERDGTFTFGGHLPPHMHHFHRMPHNSFASVFDAIQRRFDEMTRNMMSFNNFGPGFNPITDISSLPDDFNKTDSEIIELGGQRFVKKTTTLKKGGPGASFFIRSTTFEPVNENENADVPTAGEEAKKDKPEVPRPDETVPGNSSTVAPNEANGNANEDASPAKADEGSASSPDVVPSSSESPSDEKEVEGEERAPRESNEREGEADVSVSPSSSPSSSPSTPASSSTSTTEQPTA